MNSDGSRPTVVPVGDQFQVVFGRQRGLPDGQTHSKNDSVLLPADRTMLRLVRQLQQQEQSDSLALELDAWTVLRQQPRGKVSPHEGALRNALLDRLAHRLESPHEFIDESRFVHRLCKLAAPSFLGVTAARQTTIQLMLTVAFAGALSQGDEVSLTRLQKILGSVQEAADTRVLARQLAEAGRAAAHGLLEPKEYRQIRSSCARRKQQSRWNDEALAIILDEDCWDAVISRAHEAFRVNNMVMDRVLLASFLTAELQERSVAQQEHSPSSRRRGIIGRYRRRRDFRRQGRQSTGLHWTG